jgi:hypothetical protein
MSFPFVKIKLRKKVSAATIGERLRTKCGTLFGKAVR